MLLQRFHSVITDLIVGWYVYTRGWQFVDVCCFYIKSSVTSPYNAHLLTSVDVVPLMKTAGVVENSGHCMYSAGLKCS